MKKITLAILLFAASHAHAESYQEAYLKVDTCHQLGEYAAKFYLLREIGEPKYQRADSGTHMDLIFQYAVDYAWGDATTAQDARSHVWAKCMDNYDWAVANDRNGLTRPDKLHY